MTRSSQIAVAVAGAQLAAIIVLVFLTDLESPAFRSVLLLVAGGAIVNALLPARHRLAFFAALSVMSVYLVLGRAGGAVIAIGALLIAVCHLPLPFVARAGLLVVAGAGMAIARVGVLDTGLPETVWIILASMLMFRLGIYLVAVRRAESPRSVAGALAYVFMVPNATFPFFPLVDHATFLRSHGAAPLAVSFDRGLAWILRGVLHLLAYRLVVYDIAPREALVYGLGDLVRYVVSALLLYLKISGHFHIITGILQLFGFNLPPTHRWYFLATGFADFTRRANTYVRDFLLKTVYYPLFLRLRSTGPVIRIAAATTAVFAASWALHGYQYFWITGRPLWSLQDMTFWATFAVVVSIGSLVTLGRPQSPTPPAWSLRRGTATLVSFSAMAVLWSWWSASSAENWLFLWTQARFAEPADWVVLACVSAVIMIAGASPLSTRGVDVQPSRAANNAAAYRLVLSGSLCLMMLPGVQNLLPGRAQQYAEHLRGVVLPDQQDVARLRGYYEDLTPQRAGATPIDNREDSPDLFVPRDDFLLNGLRPAVDGKLKGQSFRTNSAGFRGNEVTRAVDDRTFRISVIGPSDALGVGVADDEAFPAVLEVRLDSVARRSGKRVEVLNFSFPAWTLPQRVLAMREHAAAFAPALVILVVNPFEQFLLQLVLPEAARRGIAPPDSALGAVIASARIASVLEPAQRAMSVRRIEEPLLVRSLAWAAEIAAGMNARVVVVTVTGPGLSWVGGLTLVRRVASAQGIPVVECGGVWRWRNGGRFRLSEGDPHPNPAGHQLIAQCVSNELLRSGLLAPFLEGPP